MAGSGTRDIRFMNKTISTILIIFIAGISASVIALVAFYYGARIVPTALEKELNKMQKTLNWYATTTDRIYEEYLPKNDYCLVECQQPSDRYAEECRRKCKKGLLR